MRVIATNDNLVAMTVNKAFKLHGVVKDYAWGNIDYIPSLVGGFDGGPKAELWMGTHKLGDAELENGEHLSSFIQKHPEIVEKGVFDKFKSFPLLFKVLAIAAPLSLQCHPNKAQAEDGWRREEKARERGDECNYKDDNEKAEIIAAISPITAMCGFRNPQDIELNLKKVIPASYEKYLSGLTTPKKLFLGLYDLNAEERKEILDELRYWVENSQEPKKDGPFLTENGIAARCLDLYPGDIGAIFPYILNVVHLEKGEALFLEPDILHAYVFGNGIELMSASDNVLRGGLTQKRIDLDELSRIMKFTSNPVSKVIPVVDEYGRKVYKTPSDAFELVAMQKGQYQISNGRCAILIAIEGGARLVSESGELEMKKGEIAFIPSTIGDYRLDVDALVYGAEVPLCNM